MCCDRTVPRWLFPSSPKEVVQTTLTITLEVGQDDLASERPFSGLGAWQNAESLMVSTESFCRSAVQRKLLAKTF